MVRHIFRLWHGRGGAIIPLFALSALALIAVGGAAVDMARFYLVRDKAQTSLDKALLAASSAASVEEESSAVNYFAEGIFRANFPDNYFGIARPTISITVGNQDITGSVDLSVPGYFTSLYGLQSLDTTVTSSFRRADPRHLEIVLVVERSSSLNVRSPDDGGTAYSPCTTSLANNYTLTSSCRRTLFEDVQDSMVAFVRDVFDAYDQPRIDAEKIRMGVVFYNDNVAFYERQAWHLYRRAYPTFRFYQSSRYYPGTTRARNFHIQPTNCFFARPRNNPQFAATNSTGMARQTTRQWDDLLDVNDVPLWTANSHMVPMAHFRKGRDRAVYASTYEEARFNTNVLVPYYLYEWNCLERWRYPDPTDTSSPWAHINQNSPLYSPSLALDNNEELMVDTIEMASPHGGAALVEGLAWGLRMLSPRWVQHWLIRVTQSTQGVTNARGNATWYSGYAPPYDEDSYSTKILILVGTGESRFPLETRAQWSNSNTSAGLAAPDMPINYANSPAGSNFAQLSRYLERNASDFINLTENNYTNTLASGRYKGTLHAYGWSNFGPCMGHRPPNSARVFHYLDYETVEQHCFNPNATGCTGTGNGRSTMLACYRHVALMSPTTDLAAGRDNDTLASRDSSSNKRVQDELEARAYADVCPYLESRGVMVFTIGVVTTAAGDVDTRRNAVNERIRRCVAQEHWDERTFTAINERELMNAFDEIRSFLITPRFID